MGHLVRRTRVIIPPADVRFDPTSTTLNGYLSSTATSMVVNGTFGFPAAPFEVKIEEEVLNVTSVSGATFYIQRGRDGTIAGGHSSGATVTRVLSIADDISNEDDVLVLIPTQQADSHYTFYLPENPVVGQVHTFVYYLDSGRVHSIHLATTKHRFSNSTNAPREPWVLAPNTSPTGLGFSIIYVESPTMENNIPMSTVLNGSILGLCGTCNVTTSGYTSLLTNLNTNVKFTEYNIKPGDTIAVYNSFGPPVDFWKRRVISVDSDTQLTIDDIGTNVSGKPWQLFINEGLWFPIV